MPNSTKKYYYIIKTNCDYFLGEKNDKKRIKSIKKERMNPYIKVITVIFQFT